MRNKKEKGLTKNSCFPVHIMIIQHIMKLYIVLNLCRTNQKRPW